jgi:hypothetical protein
MSCNQTLAGLAKDCATSMGGIRTVYIANYDDVKRPTPVEGKISAIEMVSGKTFHQYFFKKNTGSMTSTLNVNTDSGNYVTTDLVLSFLKMETRKRIEMSALAANELVVIVEDCNGAYWYLGYDEPVTAGAGEGVTGVQKTDANRYGLTLRDESLEFPYEVDATAIATLLG